MIPGRVAAVSFTSAACRTESAPPSQSLSIRGCTMFPVCVSCLPTDAFTLPALTDSGGDSASNHESWLPADQAPPGVSRGGVILLVRWPSDKRPPAQFITLVSAEGMSREPALDRTGFG